MGLENRLSVPSEVPDASSAAKNLDAIVSELGESPEALSSFTEQTEQAPSRPGPRLDLAVLNARATTV